MKIGDELGLLDELTGDKVSYGRLRAMRQIGPFTLYLTFQNTVELTTKERGIWWVLIDDSERGAKDAVGFRNSRKDDAYELYHSDVEHIRESLKLEPVIGNYKPEIKPLD